MDQDDIDLTLYLVGSDEEAARSTLPFIDRGSAELYGEEEYGKQGYRIYTVLATLDFTTIEPAN